MARVPSDPVAARSQGPVRRCFVAGVSGALLLVALSHAAASPIGAAASSGPASSAPTATPPPPPPASCAASPQGAKDIVAELIPAPPSASPGSVVRLIYSVMNYEDTDARVRLCLDLPEGWRVLSPEALDTEHVIEALDEIDGEVLVTVAKSARPGTRELLKIVAVGGADAGAYEGRNFVTITRGGGVKPGQVALTGATTVGMSRLSRGHPGDARTSGGVSLSGKISPKTSVTISAGRDMNAALSNYRYNLEPVKVTGTLRTHGVDLTAGNLLFSSGSAITGPFVRGRGASLRKASGRLVGDFTYAQPTTWDGRASGRLVRGRIGVSGPAGSVALVASDFSRPTGYTTLLPPITLLDPEEAERQEAERRNAEAAARTRVFGTGLDAEWRPGKRHLIGARAGALHLSNARGVERTAPAAEASYGYTGHSATLNLRWREMPEPVPGVPVGGDEVWADGSVRVLRDLRVVAQGQRSSFDAASSSQGGSGGLRYQHGGWRLEARGNYRESVYTSISTRRTGTVSFAVPAGKLSVNGHVEVGTNEPAAGGRTPLHFYRAGLRYSRDGALASVGLTQVRNGFRPPQQRLDVLGSIKVGEYELTGGAWVTRGYVAGGHPGVWGTVTLPILLDLTAIVGLEYAPLTYLSSPGWRGSLAFRRPLAVPLGFLGLRDRSLSPASGTAPPR